MIEILVPSPLPNVPISRLHTVLSGGEEEVFIRLPSLTLKYTVDWTDDTDRELRKMLGESMVVLR